MRRIALPTLLALLLVPAAAHAAVDLTVPAPARDTEPVILTGKDLGDWAAPANQTAKLPLMDLVECPVGVEPGAHRARHRRRRRRRRPPASSCNEAATTATPSPRSTPAPRSARARPSTASLAFRWDEKGFAGRWQEIPIQVDEQFTRYLDNSASGFSPYSGQDQHTTYAYDREGFRWRAEDPVEPVRRAARLARSPPTRSPASTRTTRSPSWPPTPARRRRAAARSPKGITDLADRARRPERRDRRPQPEVPLRRAHRRQRASPPSTARTATSSYKRDANADIYELSESSYDNYGNAPVGMTCDANGNPTGKEGRRRPRDYATISTDRYRFRYDGRWLMTKVEISPDSGKTYGPDLVDRWKARAFAQDPGSETPCCGFEEEDTNWGGSSTLLGEKVGPVRAIRETWGADSGTNVIRRETFYRKRDAPEDVAARARHPAARRHLRAVGLQRRARRPSSTTRTSRKGVDIDGRNDEVLGNLDDPCQDKYDAANNPNDTSAFDQQYRSLYEMFQFCRLPVPPLGGHPGPDPLRAGRHARLDRRSPASTARSSTATTRSTCRSRRAARCRASSRCPTTATTRASTTGPAATRARRSTCARATRRTRRRTGTTRALLEAVGRPARAGSDHFYQGSIATHGLHILLIADSDNARQTVPLTEMVAEQRMVMLPGMRDGKAGEQYGRTSRSRSCRSSPRLRKGRAIARRGAGRLASPRPWTTTRSGRASQARDPVQRAPRPRGRGGRRGARRRPAPRPAEIRNHVGSQHAGALFSAGEAASGAAFVGAFAEQLGNLTPLAESADIAYRKLAQGVITATATLDTDLDELVAALDEDGVSASPSRSS